MAFWSKKEDTGYARMLADLMKAFGKRLDRFEKRLDATERERKSDFDFICRIGEALNKVTTPRKEESRSEIRESLPLVDRMQEIALVAMGHADLAQQFGLTTRQKEVAEGESEAQQWEEPASDTDDGVTYSG